MIALIIVICLTWIPVEPITSVTPWEEQGIEQIEHEPSEDEIDLGRRRYRIMEVMPDDH